jgi:hypothetical protein
MLVAIVFSYSEIGSEIATACGITAEGILKFLTAEPRLPAGRMGSAGSGHWQGVVMMGMVGRSGDVMTPSRFKTFQTGQGCWSMKPRGDSGATHPE